MNPYLKLSKTRVPHVRDGFIVANVGIGRSPTFPQSYKAPRFKWVICFLLSALSLGLSLHAQPAKSIGNGKISGAATYTLTKEFLAAAPKRFYGSPGHAAAEKFIESHFAPEQKDHRLDIDEFSANTPAGLQTLRNIIVKYPAAGPGKKDGIIVLGSHYETNYPLKDIDFVGANDGACTSALLMEIGAYFPPASAAGILRLPRLLRRRRGREGVERDRLHLRLAPPRREVVAGRYPRPHQGLPAGRHDRRQVARHRPGRKLRPAPRRSAEAGRAETPATPPPSPTTTLRWKTTRFPSTSAASRCSTSSTTTTARTTTHTPTAGTTPRRTPSTRSARNRCKPAPISSWS